MLLTNYMLRNCLKIDIFFILWYYTLVFGGDTMNCKSITIYKDVDNNFEKAIIETDIGKMTIEKEEDLNKALKSIAEQDKITVEELYKSDFVKVIKKEERKSEDKRGTLDDLTDEEYEIFFGTKNNKKAKGKKTIKRLLAGATVIALLGTGTYFIVENRNVIGGKLKALFNHDKKIETTVNKNNTGKITYVSSSSTSSKNDEKKNNNNSEYDKTMEGVIKRQEENDKVMSQIMTQTTVELSNEEILQALNDNSRIANSSIFEISQYINDRGLSGTAYYYNFETLFTNGSADYNAVKMFSDMRNDIVKETFKNKDAADTKSKIKEFYTLYTEFVMVGDSRQFDLNGKSYSLKFDDLSDLAQTTILEIGSAMFTIDLDYKYSEGKYSFDKEEILNTSVEMLECELIPRLVNKGYRK